MDLSISRKIEARKIYEAYWESYAKGDLETFASTLDDQYEMIGTSETEVCHSKADGIAFLKAQMHEVVGKTEMRNRQIEVLPLENLILINEQCDVYVLTDSDMPADTRNWNFYSKIRLSTILRETESGWKVTQQHGSFPDLRVQEGETLALEKINKENLELRDAVKRRTAELENKNRELAIEAALEKVRTRTMAMHKSGDLREVVKVLFDQMQSLSIDMGFASVSIFVFEEGSRNITQWIPVQDGVVSLEVPHFDHPISSDLFDAKDSGDDFFSKVYTLEEKNTWLEKGFELTDYKDLPVEFKSSLLQAPGYAMAITLAKNSGICIPSFIGALPLPEDVAIMKRVGKVFEQAYIRFLDLQKAEEQTREAEIELALERVRARTMAMQHSDELTEASEVLDRQVRDLGIQTWGCAFHIYADDPAGDYEWFTSRVGSLPFYKTPRENFFLKFYEKGKAGEIFHVEEFLGEDCKIHYDYLMTIPVMGDALRELVSSGAALPESQYDHIAFFKHGFLLFITYQPVPESHTIFQRFAKVFEQTYTRFLDLQKAEAQAREAQVELSLEKIRAQVASMQESTDLLDIMVNIRGEFVALGHEANYFWYMRWLPDHYEKAMTSGEGTQVGMIMSLPRHIHGDIPLVADWERGEEPTLIFPMEVDTAVDYVDKMITLGDFVQVDPHAPTLDDIRHIGGLTFIMARTSQGEIGYSLPGYVQNPPLEAVTTLARFAGVFDLAFKRFDDLKKAEKDLVEIKAAKRKAEEALTELKSTQSQLVQQEKLASLGQLTAGIAHEIKNPLNFVNNFSDLSRELIEEVFAELENLEASATKEEIIAILQDVQSNLTKVHEHGTRANGIVTSMLQHSRASGSKREPKAFNPLVKEFVNLSYHGMRAGKAPILVDIDLQLDPQVKDVILISEDFSRVILNLCNNAFDAMRDKLKSVEGRRETGDEGRDTEVYLPKLTVKTTMQKDKVILSIGDNGSGIPEDIRDKILQPFFTTKKGTEGTGLGLSITNDIIKAQGGELKVESKEGEGSEFVIYLTLNN